MNLSNYQWIAPNTYIFWGTLFCSNKTYTLDGDEVLSQHYWLSSPSNYTAILNMSLDRSKGLMYEGKFSCDVIEIPPFGKIKFITPKVDVIDDLTIESIAKHTDPVLINEKGITINIIDSTSHFVNLILSVLTDMGLDCGTCRLEDLKVLEPDAVYYPVYVYGHYRRFCVYVKAPMKHLIDLDISDYSEEALRPLRYRLFNSIQDIKGRNIHVRHIYKLIEEGPLDDIEKVELLTDYFLLAAKGKIINNY